MSQPAKAEVIQVPNTLRLKVGGRPGPIDPAMLAKAEAALQSLSGQFSAWLDEEIAKLEAARTAVKTEGASPQTVDNLFTRAHDLKGLGATYDFPIVTRMAGSVCKLLDDPVRRLAAPMFLVDAHIDAIKAAVRDNIRDDAHPVGKILAEELERRVAKHLNG